VRGVEPDFQFFIKGILIGFAIAAPVGPIGVLCIRRTLLNGVASGLASGTGAALADSFYGAVAAFGLTAIAEFIRHYTAPMQMVGGLFLLYLGLQTFRKKPYTAEEVTQAKTHVHSLREVLHDFSSTFLLTLTNPATVLSFVAIFAGLGMVTEDNKLADYAPAMTMVCGVFLGSLLWWCILSGGIGLVRHRLDHKALGIANMVSAVIIGGFGVAVLTHLILTKLLH